MFSRLRGYMLKKKTRNKNSSKYCWEKRNQGEEEKIEQHHNFSLIIYVYCKFCDFVQSALSDFHICFFFFHFTMSVFMNTTFHYIFSYIFRNETNINNIEIDNSTQCKTENTTAKEEKKVYKINII